MEDKLKDVKYIENAVKAKCTEIGTMLADKNRKYGNAALNPLRIFSKANPGEQIRVRLDDKISRLSSAQLDDEEDPIKDMIGYLILLLVLKDLEEQ